MWHQAKIINSFNFRLNRDDSTLRSVEETEDLATDLLLLGLLMVHNTLVGGEDHETELTGGENWGGEVFEVLQLQVETGWDNTALVETAVQVNDNLASASIINDGELVDVALGLHQTEDLDQHLGNGVEDNLHKFS